MSAIVAGTSRFAPVGTFRSGSGESVKLDAVTLRELDEFGVLGG